LRELSRNKEGQILDLEQKKESLENRKKLLSDLKKQLEETEKILIEAGEIRKKAEKELVDIEDKIDEKKKYENEIDKTKILLISKREQIVKFEKDEREIRGDYEENIKKFNQEELDRTTKNLEEKQKQQKALENKNVELLTKISSLNSKKSELNSMKEKIIRLKICPTCLQDVSETYKTNIFLQTESDLKKTEHETSILNEEKQKTQKELKELVPEVTNLENQKRSFEILKIKIDSIKEKYGKLSEIEKQKQILSSDIELLNKHVELLKDSIRELVKFDNIYIIKEKELELAVKKEKEIEIKKAEFFRELEINNKEISILENEISEKEKTKKQLLYLTELEQWLSDKFIELVSFIEKNVMFKLKDEFSKLFNEWFSVLVSDSLSVKLDDSFTPLIEQQGYELDYSYLSGGERTAVALAYRLALNQTINSLLSKIKTRDLVILDEPTDGFSEQQLDKMQDIFSQLKVKQLILVSHESKIENFVDKIIRFSKEGGITKIG